ncbi:ATP-dependent Clp protease ATP-binding subunit [Pseudonocardia ailaonensis]|uniref:ATP-dependent Clp protease ATP-binding subunit n=1 Tax=Pseudonocardia ailaonensis TaxID=367279 RepID=A0ABN2N2C4_9PSEU
MTITLARGYNEGMAQEPFGPLEELLKGLVSGFGMPGDEPGEEPGARTSTKVLDRFGHDLTADARAGRLDPVLGRDAELDQVVEVLARRTKNNPVLVGEPGVGKTAIVEGLAARIAAGDVPAALRDVRLISVDLAGMVAGTRYRGDFEERLGAVVDEVVAAGRSVVLFVDEIHTVVGAGSSQDQAMDAGAILKPALARGDLQLVGATTPEDRRRHLERDAALDRRFEYVRVPEPTPEATAGILRGLRARYEEHHRVRITDGALDAAVALSVRYLRDRFLPDKALDLVDRAAARAALRGTVPEAPDGQVDALVRAREVAADAGDDERVAMLDRELERLVLEKGPPGPGTPQVTGNDVAEVVAQRTGIPVADLSVSERQRLLDLEAVLHRRVVGQDAAIEAVADAVRGARAGLAGPDRPVGSFLFLGPTGVGKTELARALAAALFGSVDRLVRLDLSEYGERSAVNRLIGAPPGYVGHEEAGQLTEPIRRDPYTVVLLDEIEKAHPDVLATLLQVLDAGRLTDARGRTVDFRHALLVMTSNLGAEEILAAGSTEAVEESVLALARRRLRPEFLNRIDDVVLFHPLGREHLREITELLLTGTRERLAAQGITLEVTPAALDRLAERGHDPHFGARPLRRLIGREVERKAARLLLSGEVRDRLLLDLADDGTLRLTTP